MNKCDRSPQCTDLHCEKSLKFLFGGGNKTLINCNQQTVVLFSGVSCGT